MPAQMLHEWIDINEDRLLQVCLANTERLLTAADEVDGLLTGLTAKGGCETASVTNALDALLDLLLELPQTRLLVAEMFGGVRLHPSDQPTADEVARSLQIVRNVFVKAATSSREEDDERAMQLLEQSVSSGKLSSETEGGQA